MGKPRLKEMTRLITLRQRVDRDYLAVACSIQEGDVESAFLSFNHAVGAVFLEVRSCGDKPLATWDGMKFWDTRV